MMHFQQGEQNYEIFAYHADKKYSQPVDAI